MYHNKVVLIGRLTKDISIEPVNGTIVGRSNLAVNKAFKIGNDRSADFIPLQIWGKIAETHANYIKKGDMAFVEGRVQTRSFETTENGKPKKNYMLEFIVESIKYMDKTANGSYNNVDLLGRLTKDLELGTSPSGKKYARGTIAIQRSYKNAQGQRETDFIPFQVWGDKAETYAKNTQKGSLIMLGATLQTRTYNEGNSSRFVMEVVGNTMTFLGGVKKENSGTDPRWQYDQQNEPPQQEEQPYFGGQQ
ncbi:single-stranded DNA-binding protein [Lysinibacillus sp. 1P01SD]|uniref:single-stranded DNA-binding protein n=1 Tax=Lysinibacillus sp. 1P01SD TaxID=3132285 RepID=UPI00399F4078